MKDKTPILQKCPRKKRKKSRNQCDVPLKSPSTDQNERPSWNYQSRFRKHTINVKRCYNASVQQAKWRHALNLPYERLCHKLITLNCQTHHLARSCGPYLGRAHIEQWFRVDLGGFEPPISKPQGLGRSTVLSLQILNWTVIASRQDHDSEWAAPLINDFNLKYQNPANCWRLSDNYFVEQFKSAVVWG